MFTAIARFYDLNNSLLSFGLHHHWKRVAGSYVPATEGGWALDVGAGTGDLAIVIDQRMNTLRACHCRRPQLGHAPSRIPKNPRNWISVDGLRVFK